jgi:hypothetical protein
MTGRLCTPPGATAPSKGLPEGDLRHRREPLTPAQELEAWIRDVQRVHEHFCHLADRHRELIAWHRARLDELERNPVGYPA